MQFNRFWMPGFWSAALFTLVMASLPHPPPIPGEPSDKLQHVVAFVVLTILARLAYPRGTWWRIALGLSAFGVLIELVQMIPALNRDCEFADWAADTAAVLAVLAILALVRKYLPWPGVQSS